MKALINNLKTRRSMYLFDDTYKGIISYLMGYQFAVMELTKENISEEIQEWLKNKVGNSFSTHWSDYIYTEMAQKNEENAKLLLLDLLEEFCDLKKVEKFGKNNRKA